MSDHPDIEDEAGGKESQCGEEQRREFAHADADEDEGGSPDEVDDAEGEQGLPAGAMSVGFHGS